MTRKTKTLIEEIEIAVAIEAPNDVDPRTAIGAEIVVEILEIVRDEDAVLTPEIEDAGEGADDHGLETVSARRAAIAIVVTEIEMSVSL